jgi:hypothetical protein
VIALALAASLLAAPPVFRAADLVVPDAIEKMDVPDNLRALGVPVKLRAVRSKQKVEPLLAHFREAFAKAGLFVPEPGELHSAGNLQQVTGLDVLNHNSVSVLLQPNLDGTTTVVVGEAYFHAAKDADEAFAPVFPGSAGLIVANLEVGQSMAYSANAAPDEVMDFYRQTLAAIGYRETAPGRFGRKSDELRLWLKPRADETGVVVIKNVRP